MVLFVVSADEGVMPQTVEHLDILNFLNIKNGIIVLTKCDTVDGEFIELVKEDIKEKVKGSFLEDVDIIEVDSVSKRGIEKLINKIDYISNEIEESNENSPARLNIDRVFSVKGFGTVITGTLIEGKISIEDELEIYPKELKTKIRSIQVHGETVKTAYAGQRTAINISNVKVDDIQRGDVLASKNSLEDVMMIDVKISLVNHSDKNLKHWDRLRLYHGTKEILCRAVPLDKEIIETGESGYVQLRLEEKIVVKKGDAFVVRCYSPMETIGGGIVIDTAPKKHKRFDENVIKALKVKEKGELKDILEEYLKRGINFYPTKKEIMAYSGDSEDNINNALEKLIKEGKIVLINNIYMHINQYRLLEENSIKLLTDYHKKHRLKKGILKEEFRSKIESKFKTKEIDILIDKLNKEKIIKLEENLVSLYEFKVILNEKQKEIKNKISTVLQRNAMDLLLTIDDICKGDRYYQEVIESMIGYDIEKLDDTYIMDKQMYLKAKEDLIEYLKVNNEITLGEYRDLVNSSRKNCMIILENFDRNKITKRNDNKRILF
jgi:selenocysteine-specific elongation factor